MVIFSKNQSEFTAILDDIPIDCDSITSDIENIMADEISIDDAIPDQRGNLFNLENIPIIFTDDIGANVTEEWYSEDELPVEVICQEKLRKKAVVE